MADEQTPPEELEGQGLDPDPDPWIPPRAGQAQAGSIILAVAGAGAVTADGTAQEQSLLWLPDPMEVFGRVAHLVGIQLDASSVFTWGLVLIFLSILLNIYSFLVRYRFALWVKPRWDAQHRKLKSEAAQWRRMQGATPPAKAQGSGGGAA